MTSEPASSGSKPVPAPDARAGQPAPRARAPIVSDALFGGAKEVQILHRGTLYRLKQTALGKLILTK
ncbi:hemin uptake protein HemP [Piscinibacter koreensis]|uniref:Hemin uptake protein HemP n=1 Tax=Piscinibacter koreensis TaxID=2742824 RepID=A0A7Y6NJR4_9BURK|nr:hemin uptake protein HemP [Schlegelella koreensis]